MNHKLTMTRAESVRKRRAVEAAQEAQEKRALKPVSPLRPSKKTNFVGAKKRKKNIRQYEAAAFNPAYEGLRSFAMPAIRLEWRAASAALTIILSIVLYLLWTSPYFMVSVPQIKGNQYLSSEKINRALDLSGKKVFSLVPQYMERHLRLTYPELADVEITTSLPNLVNVNVKERQPVLIWQQDGMMAWIDANGVAIRSNAQVDGLITVTALGPPLAPVVDESTYDELAPPPFIAPTTVAALQSLIAHVPPGTPIIYDPQSGLGWTDPRGWTVQLGDITEEIGLKLRIYESIVTWVTQKNIQPVLINLEYPHAPYYRTEP